MMDLQVLEKDGHLHGPSPGPELLLVATVLVVLRNVLERWQDIDKYNLSILDIEFIKL
jgi:hypothetical protein